jgi:hypothetical protein
MRRIDFIFGALFCAGLSAGTTGAQIVAYGFSASSAGPTSSDANVVGGPVANGGGVMTTSNSSPVSSGYSGASGGYFIFDNGWTGAAPGTNYFQFTVTPSSASVAVTSISFGYRESGTNTGPTSFFVRSSADGYGADLASGSLTNSDNNWHSTGATSVTLTFTSTTTLRIYANGASNNTPTLRIDDISLNGTVTAIPEPESVAAWLGAFALGAAVIGRSRRKRCQSARAYGPTS